MTFNIYIKKCTRPKSSAKVMLLYGLYKKRDFQVLLKKRLEVYVWNMFLLLYFDMVNILSKFTGGSRVSTYI